MAWRAAPGRGKEYLDDPAADPKLAARSLRDPARRTRRVGGISPVTSVLLPVFLPARSPAPSRTPLPPLARVR